MIRNDSPDATGGEVDSPTRAMTTVSFEDARKLEGFDLDREDNHAKIRDGEFVLHTGCGVVLLCVYVSIMW